MMLTFDTSIQWLAIPEAVHTESWQQSQAVAISGRWQTYLNQVCLKTILPWLQEKSGAEPVVALDTSNLWEWVNGSAVTLGHTRLIIVPTEAMGTSELRVPQEWIDIPDWIGDYYLAVEVDTDEQGLRIWGYSTHEQLKCQGHYDEIDRSYSLTDSELIPDLGVFWVMQQLSPEPTRVEIPSLPSLPATEAEALIQRVDALEMIAPRLQVPFLQWAALLESNRWLQRLYQRRSEQPQQELAERNQTGVQLSQWLRNIVEPGWQAIAELFRAEPDLAFSFRREDESQSLVRRVKQIQLAAELPHVILAMGLEPEPDGRIRIEVQVLPGQGTAVLPANLQLVMSSTAGEILQSVEAGEQSRYIQLRRFKCSPGTAFRLQIRLADVSVTEDFMA